MGRLDFDIELPSNASMLHYPNNSASHYKINLPTNLHLKNYEVAMTGFYFTKDMKTIMNEAITLKIPKTISDILKINLKPTTNTFEEAFKEITDAIQTSNPLVRLWTTKVAVDGGGLKVNEEVHKRYIGLFLNNSSGKEIAFSVDKSLANLLRINKVANLALSNLKPDSVITSLPTRLAPRETALLKIDLNWFITGENRKKKKYAITAFTIEQKEAIIKLRSGYYPKPIDLVNMMNAQIRKTVSQAQELFTYDIGRNRINIQIKNSRFIKEVDISSCRALLGFRSSKFNGKITHQASFPPELTRGIQTIYIYSNIIEPVCVGDSMVPIVASIPLSRKNQGLQEYMEFNIPTYNPVIQDPFKTVEIDIRDDAGAPLNDFLIGKTNLRLHFRKIR